jgi:hypothetical protein
MLAMWAGMFQLVAVMAAVGVQQLMAQGMVPVGVQDGGPVGEVIGLMVAVITDLMLATMLRQLYMHPL